MRELITNNLSLSREYYLGWCSQDLSERLEKLAKSKDEIERKLLMEEIQAVRRGKGNAE